MPKQKIKKAHITPGPYTMRKGLSGYFVNGIHGVGIAWVAENGTYGTNGSHVISSAECKANAEFILAALQKQ